MTETTEKKQRKKAAGSPTRRSLKFLRDNGYVAGVVEKWIPSKFHPAGGVRKDLLDFIDIMAFKEGEVLAVQSTSYSGVSSRVKKIESDDLAANVAAVRKAGVKIHVHGWKKNALRNRWELRVVDLS